MKRVIIIGAAGRDFHNFNMVFRNSPDHEVVAFTAAQIPGIEGRTYPPELAGPRYPNGIPIFAEKELARLIKELKADLAILSYSDLSYGDVMHIASSALAAGADFELLGPRNTMLSSRLPVVSVGAVRTGAGKSTVSRKISLTLRDAGKKVVVIRHPMPYGDLTREGVQRFASFEDLDKADCSIEEREEYEPHIEHGFVVYAGIDYEQILRSAEKEADIILWDGGNNDIPFIQPNVHFAVLDPLRAGDELTHYPSEVNVRIANVGIINKVNVAEPKKIQLVESNLKALNPTAIVIKAASEVTVDKPELVRGKRVLVIEDGPTVTHGDMAYGVGYIAAKSFHAKEIVDPRMYAVGIVKDIFKKYTHVTEVLPTVGYGNRQVRDMEATIAKVDCDTIIIATPADIRRIMKFPKPTARVGYELKEQTRPGIKDVLRTKGII
ncbi:MAG TPA: cyclic 2,3-diphosphoglycerate synthase [Candidatus Bathyarchaeia archaeon]|nr:cyclic 2,3-diphosphoglycerate synthase [Candidatus Bathyarchaeia archaeon]